MDYIALGLGSLTSIVTAVDAGVWDRTVTLSCRYNPGGEDRPYTITFCGCTRISSQLIDAGQSNRDLAELLEIDLGAAQHQRPAQITTDTFELVVRHLIAVPALVGREISLKSGV